MYLACVLFLTFANKLYVSGSPGISLLESLTKDFPCQDPTTTGFNDPDEDEFGFVSHSDKRVGETFSSCWSIQFYGDRILQFAFYFVNITAEGTCIQVYSGSTSMYVSNELLGTFCGSERPPLITVTYSPATIVYHTNSTRNGQSFEAVFNVIDDDEQCGGLLTEPEGEIHSVDRDGNGLYDPHLQCVTIIAAPKNYLIEIIFIHFNLTYSSFCSQDHVIIIDTGLFSEEYCGDEIPPRTTTTTNIVRVIFRSTWWNPFKTKTHTGFLARYSFLNEHACHYEVNDTVGYIEYDENDVYHQPVVSCTWTIQAGENKVIQLYLTYLDIPSKKQCTDNYLEIQNATGIYGVYCGSHRPQLIQTTYSHLTLKLHLKQRETSVGFKAIYTITDRFLACGRIVTETPWQIKYPVFNIDAPWFHSLYGINLGCVWIIIAPDDYQIVLEFSQLEIEGQYPCPYDYLQITGSYYINETAFPRICGNEIPGKITSTTNILYLQLITDGLYSLKGFHTAGVFNHESSELCGGELSERVDTFGLMLNELQIGLKTYCHWIINNEQRREIELKIFRLHLPDDGNCTSAFVELYEDSVAAGRFCGIGSQPVKVSISTRLHIYFFSKSKYPGHGFEAIYSKSDGVYAKQNSILTLDGSHYFNSPDTGGDGGYVHRLDLLWTIIVEPGKIVQLFFLLFDLENSKDCIYDRLKVYDGANFEAQLVGIYCGTSAPKKVRATSNVLMVTFFADDTVNGNGFNVSFSQAEEFAWRQWPDYAEYSIPKSVYGCPEQSVNEWLEGYMDFKVAVDYDIRLKEKTRGYITKEQNILTLGPFQSDGFRLSFCTKRQIGTRDTISDKEWPRGSYSIFARESHKCPEGFWLTYAEFDFDFRYSVAISEELPKYEFIFQTILERHKLKFHLCVKQPDIDTATLSTDLRAPFMVISLELLKNHNDDVRQLFRHFDSDAMLGYNTSMKVVEERFQLELSHYGYTQFELDLFTFWVIVPNEPGCLFEERQDADISKLPAWALGLPDDSDENLLWLLYDLGQSVFVTGIRLVQNQDFSAKDDGTKLTIPVILISNNKWSFLEHAAFYCLPFEKPSNRSITVYCMNDPHMMSTRYLTMKAAVKVNTVLKRLLDGSWSIWLLSHKESSLCGQSLGMESGYIQDFQLNVTSEEKLFLKTNGRPGDSGWCYTDNDIDPRFQIDLLYPTWIEAVHVFLSFPVRQTQATVWIYLYKYVQYYEEMFIRVYNSNKDGHPTACLIKAVKHVYKGRLKSIGNSVLFRKRGLKNMNCENSTETETFRSGSTEVFANYLFDQSDVSIDNKTFSECTRDCQNEYKRCAVAVSTGEGCELFLSSSSYSYGTALSVGKNKQSTIQICPTVDYVRATSYITAGLSWDDLTTVVREPGFIVSHGYPYLYSSGELWVWNINFSSSTNIHIIVYNASFNQHQVVMRLNEQTAKFCDKIDRLYITDESFDLSLIFSESIISTSSGLIAMLDKESSDLVPHYITELGAIRIVWRTVVQITDSRDTRAAGFRMLSYTDDELICMPSRTVCKMQRAELNSKSFIGEYPSYTEKWIIKSDMKRYIVVVFTEFDIGCGTETKLKLESKFDWTRQFCNHNKPITAVRLSQTSLTVRFSLDKRDRFLIEGFRAFYEFQSRDDAVLTLLSVEESVVLPNHDGDDAQSALKVCSARFNKCYVLLDELNQRYNNTQTSWHFALTGICEDQGWSLVTFHSKVEQEFVVFMLLNRLNYTNYEYTYIGLRRAISINPVYTWTDNTTLTYTAWKNGQPTSVVSYSCTRMSLRMAEDSEWESVMCDSPTANVAVCQHPWNTADQDTMLNTSARIHEFIPSKLDFNPLSMFSCINGEIISLLGRCDGYPDCGDLSDEQNCTNTTDGCTTLQYQCRDGKQCVSVSMMCDYYPDCQDHSDENCYFPHCNELAELTCSNHRCINSSLRCDGKDDCRDNSDEQNCVEYNCFRSSFPCSSSQCISFVYVCDGVQDCWNGQDEINCQFPQNCSSWWMAGYQDSGVYNIGGLDVECDFGNIKTDKRILSKFHHADYGRLFSRVSNFSYTNQDSLRSLINNNECYQAIDQLCHSWVEELYKWDTSDSKLPNASDTDWSRIHPCFCIRYDTRLTQYLSGSNNSLIYKDCDGNDLPLLPETAYHVMVNKSYLYGYIQSMELKRGHVFDINQLKIEVHPIRCYSDFINITSKIACGYGFSADAATKCLYKLDVFGHIIGCRSLKHLQNCESFSCPVDFFKCPDSFCIEKQFVCDGIQQCENGEDEQNCESYSCESQYRCLQSRICLPESYICDGYPQCPLEDDERLCNFSCPSECSCRGFVVNCTLATSEGDNNTVTVSPDTRLIDVSNNPDLYQHLSLAKYYVGNLIYLNISSCRITVLSVSVFEYFTNLRVLDLSHNMIRSIPSRLFLNIQRLENLSISYNLEILTIETEAFKGLDTMTYLNLESLQIDRLSKAAFASLTLNTLDLSGNVVSEIDNNAFETLRTKSLYLNATSIRAFASDLFKGLEQVDLLFTDDYKFCCVRPYYLAEENCLPHQDEFSSCDDLMRNGILRSFVWIIGVFALLGNAAALFYHIQFDRKRLKLGYGIFVTNLAIADFIMGLYLIIIAIADMVYRGEYIIHDEYWRHSGFCKLAGVFALFASETSIFFLCLITLDRILVIKYPFSDYRFTTKPAVEASIVVWVIGLIMSVIPLLLTSYFKGEFFSKSAVCLALPLTRDRPSGWLYSVIIFIVFNFLTFLLIAWGQWLIYSEVTSDKRPLAKNAESRKKDLRVARNLLLVVLTDFLCWFPIGLLGILALTGTVIPADVYAWTAVFILPINSALNPFLYTLSAILGKKTMVPDTEEHEKTLTFLKKEIEDIFNVWQQPDICNIPRKGYTSVVSVLEGRKLRLRESVLIAKGSLESLFKLHELDIVQKDLSLNDIYIRVSKGRRHVILNCHPQLGNKKKIKAENIKDFGDLFSRLLDACQP